MGNDRIILENANDNVLDDMIQPFSFDRSAIRGRIVRLGTVLRNILAPHAYPPPIANLVAEAVTLTLLLGGMLKYEGIFTLQAQGDGPVRMVVCDLTSGGDVRAVAHYDQAGINFDSVTALRPTDKPWLLPALMGKGHLAFTVDQGECTERYQGIVALEGDHLVECVQHYFDQSEQIGTVIKVAAGLEQGELRSGGIMIQRLPLPESDHGSEKIMAAEDDWDRACALFHTCTADELIQSSLIAPDLLYRLFHEEKVRAYNPLQLRKGCRCTSEKLKGILQTMSSDDLSHMAVDGVITMTCEFCNQDFVFSPSDT